jgi:hypothetical protein
MFYISPRPPGLKNLGLPWRPEELQKLEELVNAGLDAGQIASVMERSTVAIRSKTAAQGWRLRRRSPRPQSGAELRPGT